MAMLQSTPFYDIDLIDQKSEIEPDPFQQRLQLFQKLYRIRAMQDCAIPESDSNTAQDTVLPDSANPTPMQANQYACNSSSIQLTGWRIRDHDFVNSTQQLDSNVNGSFSNDEASNTNSTYQRLAPEDLPRMYPDWIMSMPFRFDDPSDEETKGCCGNGQPIHSTIVRWFIVVISLIGLSCVIVGVILGALTVSGSTRLTLCLLMIGVGVVLITVSGLAWRLTSLETDDCISRSTCLHARTQTASFCDIANSRFAYRMCRRRPTSHQYFTDMLQNTDFIWRPPPPSYHTTMRERHSRNSGRDQRRNLDAIPALNESPPPTYRSSTEVTSRPSVVTQIFRLASRPPSYSANDQNIPMATFTPQSIEYRTESILSQPTPMNAIRQDDRASLVLNESMSTSDDHEWRPNRMTIIDCSEPVPVGFVL